VVRDRSDEHNFALRGLGVSPALTGVDFVGTKTVTVKLGAGRYTFVCTPHSDDTRGSFSTRQRESGERERVRALPLGCPGERCV
jgi:hypothetical protein